MHDHFKCRKTSREPSPSENAPGDDDDEIFFGPMGHTEKCVSKAVEDVIQEEEMIKVSIIKSKSVEYKYSSAVIKLKYEDSFSALF